MKKLISMLAIMLVSVSVFSQLNPSAELLRSTNSKEYNTIKAYAVDKWGSDNQMVVYTINKQTDAMFKVLDIIQDVREGSALEQCALDAAVKWSVTNSDSSIGIQWDMVEYEIEKWLKNSDY